jgi:hypothetical protein
MNLSEVQRGWDVFAADGDKVGDVWEVRSDHVVVSKGFLLKSDRYVPASAISSIEPGRLQLNVARDDIDAQGWEEDPVGHGGPVPREPIQAGDAWTAEKAQARERTSQVASGREEAGAERRAADSQSSKHPVERGETVRVRAGQPSADSSLADEEQPKPTAEEASTRAEKRAETREPAQVEAQGTQEAAFRADMAPMFTRDRAEDFRSRWSEIQTGFVDEPRRAVEQADTLVAEVMKRLAESFADERSKLEEQWGRSGEVNTEDLRIALQRYRSFFDRLLSL